MNPLSSKVTIPFRKGSVNCTLDIAAVYRAEQDLNMAIVSPPRPSEPPFFERPLMVQNACYLYAALSGVEGITTTIDECRAILAGPKSLYVQERLGTLQEGLHLHLLEFHKQNDNGKQSGQSDPLAAKPGGPDNGLTPSQSPGSPAKSSGARRRGK